MRLIGLLLAALVLSPFIVLGCANNPFIVRPPRSNSELCVQLCDADARSEGHLTFALYKDDVCYCVLDDPALGLGPKSWEIPIPKKTKNQNFAHGKPTQTYIIRRAVMAKNLTASIVNEASR